MKERNRQTLRDALGRLPDHSPRRDAWRKIESGLTTPLADRLPTYQPPAGVWNALNAELKAAESAPRAATREIATGRARRRLLRLTAVAAAVALLLGLGFGTFGTTNPEPKVTYAYTQQPAPTQRLAANWNEDESSFSRVITLLDERNEPALNTLRLELDELTEAKREIQAILAAYGEDPAVVRQLAEIERGRNEVYRRIINEL